MNTIDNSQDVLDSRDIIARIEEIKYSITGIPEGCSEPELEGELEALLELQSEAEQSPDWKYGETLIRETYFKEYAQELAEGCGMVAEDTSWPHNCIDWNQAARELKYDYFTVTFGGVDYLIRA